MTLSFTIEKEDHLVYQLFQASQSKRIQRKRRINWLLVPFCYLIFGGILYFLKERAYLITFAAVAGMWFAAYPFYSRWLYKRHYAKHIEDNFSQAFGKSIQITLEDNHMHIEDKGSEGRIKVTEISQIIDIGSHVFLRLKGGTALIIPRERVKSDRLDAFLTSLEGLTSIKKEILNWQWT